MKDSIIKITNLIGLKFLEPLIRLISGEETKKNTKEVFRKIVAPVASVLIFLFLWNLGASSLYNSLGEAKVESARKASGDAEGERVAALIASAKEKLNGEYILSDDMADLAKAEQGTVHAVAVKKEDGSYEIKSGLTPDEKKETPVTKAITYTGRPSFIDQVKTSLKTVFAGFLLALFIAVPIGIVIGLSDTLRGAINWVIQIFKPVSPVVWLLLVTMIVTTLLRDSDGDSSFIISFISVGLCSMWATLVNTTMGVSSVNSDYINVAKVLKLRPLQKTFKVILPASLPLIFTGLVLLVLH